MRQEAPNGDAILPVHPLARASTLRRPATASLFSEEYDAERRERFRDRGGIEESGRCDRDFLLEVGHPVAALEHQRPLPAHTDAAAGRVGLFHSANSASISASVTRSIETPTPPLQPLPAPTTSRKTGRRRSEHIRACSRTRRRARGEFPPPDRHRRPARQAARGQ